LLGLLTEAFSLCETVA